MEELKKLFDKVKTCKFLVSLDIKDLKEFKNCISKVEDEVIHWFYSHDRNANKENPQYILFRKMMHDVHQMISNLIWNYEKQNYNESKVFPFGRLTQNKITAILSYVECVQHIILDDYHNMQIIGYTCGTFGDDLQKYIVLPMNDKEFKVLKCADESERDKLIEYAKHEYERYLDKDSPYFNTCIEWWKKELTLLTNKEKITQEYYFEK